MPNEPMITCSLSRKVNLGNYETADIGMSITLPVDMAEGESLTEVVEKIATTQFKELSAQVSERYRYLKQVQAGGYNVTFEEWKAKQE